MIEVLEAAIVDGAPNSRDTLDELYDVLNAAKANLASPTFTGNARSSTPPDDDDSSRIATTGWVKENAGGISNPTFFSPGAPVSMTGAFQDLAAGNYTLENPNGYVGIVVGSTLRASSIRLRRGTVEVLPEFMSRSLSYTADFRILVVDKPGTAGPHSYALQMLEGSDRTVTNSYISIFEIPQVVAVGQLAADIGGLVQNVWRDVVTATVATNTAAGSIGLRYLVYMRVPGRGEVRIMRGGVEVTVGEALQVVASSQTPLYTGYLRDFWQDQPGDTADHTYTLQARATEGNLSDSLIVAGSYLMAETLS